MRRPVALCNFNPADYSRWEGQEGVGLQGVNATGLDQKNGGSVYLLLLFLFLFDSFRRLTIANSQRTKLLKHQAQNQGKYQQIGSRCLLQSIPVKSQTTTNRDEAQDRPNKKREQ